MLLDEASLAVLDKLERELNDKTRLCVPATQAAQPAGKEAKQPRRTDAVTYP